MKIYIIEDDTMLLSKLSRLLSNYGYDGAFTMTTKTSYPWP